MMLILLLSTMTCIRAELVGDVQRAFEDPQFTNKEAWVDGAIQPWVDTNHSKFDQGSSGLCTLYASTAVSRNAILVQTMKDATGEFWVEDSRFAGRPGVVVNQGFDANILQDKIPEILGEFWECNINETTERVREMKRNDDIATVLARLMTDYPVGSRQNEFKGLLLFTNCHTIGVCYEDGEYRLFDSYNNRFGDFFDNTKAIRVGDGNVNRIAQEVTTKWLTQGHNLNNLNGAATVFGPAQAAPAPVAAPVQMCIECNANPQSRDAYKCLLCDTCYQQVHAETAAREAALEREDVQREREEEQRFAAYLEEQRIAEELRTAERAEEERLAAEHAEEERLAAERAAAERAEALQLLGLKERLLDMGFGAIECQRAVTHCGNDFEAAVDFLLGEDAQVQQVAGPALSMERLSLERLLDMGFEANESRRAINHFGSIGLDDLDAAVDFLLRPADYRREVLAY